MITSEVKIVYQSAGAGAFKGEYLFAPRSSATLDRAQQARELMQAHGNQYVALIEGGTVTDVASDIQITVDTIRALKEVGATGVSVRAVKGILAAICREEPA